MEEKRRTIKNTYLIKNQDDLEKILETLHTHFLMVKRTSFEEMSRDNVEFLGAKEIIRKSNTELNRLQKELVS